MYVVFTAIVDVFVTRHQYYLPTYVLQIPLRFVFQNLFFCWVW